MSFPALLSAQDRAQARSMVITRRGIVATAQPLASQAAAQILARGGSAVDAAIAATAARGRGAKGLTIDYLKNQGLSSLPPTSIQSVTLPGCVDGWEKLHKR